ncbi:MAG: LVIVD repeat-containing protein, partial [Planctomycetota bacterium]
QLEDESARRGVDGAERKMQKALDRLGGGKKNALKSAVKVTGGAVKKLVRAGADESFAAGIQGVVDAASGEIERMRGSIAARLAEDDALAKKYSKKLAKVVKKVERAAPALAAGDAPRYLKKAGGLLSGLAKLMAKVGEGDGSGPPVDPGAGKGRAILGPIAGARVEIHPLANLEGGPIFVGTTTTGAIDDAGRVELNPAAYSDDALYLVVVSGGEDIDVDDDGVADDVPTPVAGKVHAVMTGAQIKAGDWRVSVLTEVAYQSILYLLQAGYDDAAILEALDQAASRLVKSDVTGDGKVDSDDLNKWDPLLFPAHTLLDDRQKEELVEQIHAGEDTGDSALESTSALLGSDSSVTFIRDIEVVGNLAYLASDLATLYVVDVADPLNPDRIGKPSGFIANGYMVAVSGITALVATQHGVYELGVEVPEAPHLVNVHAGITPTGMVGVGDLFYIATRDALEILDVSYRTDEDPDTTEPVFLDSVPLATQVGELYVAGNRLYGKSSSGVLVFDITTPGTPTLTRTVGVAGSGAAAMSGDLMFTIDGLSPRRSHLVITDLSELLQPQTLATLPLPTDGAHRMAVHGSAVYIGTANSIIVADVSTPSEPVVLGRVYIGDTGSSALAAYGSNRPFALVGRAFPNTSAAELEVYDVADPTVSGVMGGVALEPFVRRMDLSGTMAYIASTAGTLESVDLSDPAEPSVGTSVDLPNLQDASRNDFVTDVAVVGDQALVSGGSALHAVALTGPGAPSLVASDPAFDNPDQLIAGRASYAYATTGTIPNVLSQIDAGDVEDFALGAVFPESADRLVLDVVPGTSSDTIYVMGMEARKQFDVYSVTDGGADPSLLGSYVFDPSPFDVGGIDVAGDTAFVVTNVFGGPAEMTALDVDTPASISVLGSVEMERPGKVRVAGDLAVVSDPGFGIRIFDVSDPASMKEVGSTMTLGYVQDFEILGDKVVVATQFGLEVVGLPVREVP